MELFESSDLAVDRRPAGNADGLTQDKMTFFPTLLIGLGGTGAQIVLRVKKLLKERNPDGLSLHRFLFLDSDLDTFSKKAGLPPIDPAEKVIIGYGGARILLENPKQHEHIWKRFPRNRLKDFYIKKLAVGSGASQIRSLGALALAISYASVRSRIEAAYNDLVGLQQYVTTTLDTGGATVAHKVMVYVVGSFAGGTGSGCFMDLALMVKQICTSPSGDMPHQVGVFILPQAFDEKVKGDKDQLKNTRTNTYAALKELQYALDASEHFRAPIDYDYGPGQPNLRLEPGDYLFDLCYLVDNSNVRGQLGSTEDLYELAAGSIFQDVGSRFGANAQSFISNTSTFSGAKCPETNLKRHLGSFATTSLVYPAFRVAEYCTLRTLSAVVHDHLIGTAPPEDVLHNSVNAFLSEHKLDDRGAANQVLDSLLTRENEVLSSAYYGLESTWGDDLDKEVYSNRIEATWQDFRTRDVPQVEKIVEANLHRRIGERHLPGSDLKAIVQEQAINMAAEHGVTAAIEWLEDLEEIVATMREELKGETRTWQEREQEIYRQDFSDAVRRLEDTFQLIFVGTGKIAERKAALRSLYNNRVEQELYAVARPAAIEILQVLGASVQETNTEWKALDQALQILYKQSRTRWRSLETHKTSANESRFVAQIEITQPGYEKRYYEAEGLSSEDGFVHVLQEFDDSRPTLFTHLHELDSPAGIGNLFSRVLWRQIAPPLFETKLTDFVKKHPEEVEGSLAQKLSVSFQMCQPFWPVKPVQVEMNFPEYKGLSVHPERLDENKKPLYDDLIEQWADTNEYNLLFSDRPFEIILTRRTYGARAYYLNPAAHWKSLYQERLESAQGDYMMETHAAFRTIPDLFPSDNKPLELFALGMAMGFIIARGPWYYFNLKRGTDARGQSIIRVLNQSSDAVNVHTLEGIAEVPAEAGDIAFELKPFPTRLPKSRQLAQGRENAMQEVARNQDYLDLMEEAFTAYHSSVGNDTLKNQLSAYGELVLGQRSVDEGDQFDLERRAIDNRLANIGK